MSELEELRQENAELRRKVEELKALLVHASRPPMDGTRRKMRQEKLFP